MRFRHEHFHYKFYPREFRREVFGARSYELSRLKTRSCDLESLSSKCWEGKIRRREDGINNAVDLTNSVE